GNGESTIKQLIDEKQQLRFRNPSQYGNSYKIDNEVFSMLKKQGYSMDSIVEEGKRVYFKSKNNMSSGGDSVDMTDKLNKDIKKIAVDATNAIPGLVQAGVDMMINEETGEGQIIEINTRPSIRTHLFPMEGKARNIPKAIIDYYFPKTKEISSQSLLYFDFSSIWKSFRLGRIKEITVPNHPIVELKSTCFLIKAKIIAKDFDEWIIEMARTLNLNGKVQRLSKDEISITIVGNAKSIGDFQKLISNGSFKRI